MNVRHIMPGDLVVPKFQADQAHTADTDPEEVDQVTIHRGGVSVRYVGGEIDEFVHGDEIEVAAELPTEPLKLRWRAKDQKWVLNLVSAKGLPAVVVEVNGRVAFDGTPKPLPFTPPVGEGEQTAVDTQAPDDYLETDEA